MIQDVYFRITFVIILIAIILYVMLGLFSGDSLPKNSPDNNPLIHSLNSLRTDAEIYASKHNDSYGSFRLDNCTIRPNTDEGSFFNDRTSYGPDNILKILNIVGTSPINRTRCFANGNSWATAAYVSGMNSWWCVDSMGVSKNVGDATPIFTPTKLCDPDKVEATSTAIEVSDKVKYEWCMQNGGKDATPNYNSPKVCILNSRVYQNDCFENAKYFIVSKRLTESVGSDILIKYKTSVNQNISCKYDKEDQDFEIKNNDGAQYVFALENNFLIIDEGTGPEPRGLTIFDLTKRQMVYNDSYSKPVTIKNNKISYWSNTSEEATNENCSNLELNNSRGLGSAIDTYVILDLKTMSKTDTGQHRCSERQ